MSDFQPFEMERYMSVHEMEVKYNMSESGVHPILRPFTVHIRQGVNNIVQLIAETEELTK